MIRKMLLVLLPALMSAVAGPVFAANLLLDGGFEGQGATVSTYCYDNACPGGPWQFDAGSGIMDESNGAWPGILTPDGIKEAFLQGTGSLSQVFNVLVAGLYETSGQVAGRPVNYDCCQGNQTMNIMVDNVLVGTVATITGQPFTGFTTGAFNLGVGSHMITYQGLSPTDNTLIFDQAAVTAVGGAVPEPATWAMMLIGFFAIGSTLRNRRRHIALA